MSMHEALTFSHAEEPEEPLEGLDAFASDPAMSPAALEVLARRELAIQATDAISEVLEVDVTVPALLSLASESEEPQVHLAAVRALRCIESIAREDSAVIQAIGETGVYHYVEGVIQYGASERKYLELLDGLKLTPEEVTGLYALREAIADETNGQKPGFATLFKALEDIDMSIPEAAFDYETALAALYEAGFILDHAGSKTFDRPIFSPRIAQNLGPLGADRDTHRGEFIVEEVKIDPDFPEERED